MNPFAEQLPGFLDATGSATSTPVTERHFSAAAKRSVPERSLAAAAAAVPSNTALDNSQQLASGGVDWLEATIYGTFAEGDDGYLQTQLALEEGRAAAEAGSDSSAVEFVGGRMVMGPKGFRWGNTFFKWTGECNGISYAFGSISQSKACAVAKVRIGSLRLMLDGAAACWAEATRTLAALGVEYSHSVLYRIDVCLDLPGVPVDDYVEALRQRECITRLRSPMHVHYAKSGDYSGVSIGNRKGVFLEIYDKIRELADKSGPEADAKYQILVANRWGCQPDVATRVEFQIRGDWIRGRYADLRSVEQVLEALPQMTGYLVQGFFRLVDGQVDNENYSRAKTSPCWQRVIDGFFAWLESRNDLLERAPELKPNRDSVVRRWIASTMSVLAMSPDYVDSKNRALQRLVDILSRHLPSQDDLMVKLRRKWEQWEGKGVLQAMNFSEVPEGDWAKTVFNWENEQKTAWVRYEVGFDDEPGDEW